VLVLLDQVLSKKIFSSFLKVATDSVALVELDHSTNRETVMVKVRERERDFVPLWDGTTRRHSL